jgi:hypothetical protein
MLYIDILWRTYDFWRWIIENRVSSFNIWNNMSYSEIAIYIIWDISYLYSLENTGFLGPRMELEWQYLAACRLEEVRFFRRDGIAKVLGTIICIGGAMTVSLYKGMVIIKADQLHNMNLLQLEADQYTQPFRNLAILVSFVCCWIPSLGQCIWLFR